MYNVVFTFSGGFHFTLNLLNPTICAFTCNNVQDSFVENYLTLKFEFEKHNIAMLSWLQRQDASWSLCIQCKASNRKGERRGGGTRVCLQHSKQVEYIMQRIKVCECVRERGHAFTFILGFPFILDVCWGGGIKVEGMGRAELDSQ